MQEITIEACQKQKKKDKKRKYQRERYDMSTNLNEKLKQYERNY